MLTDEMKVLGNRIPMMIQNSRDSSNRSFLHTLIRD
jgi:hypothetical protein